MTIAARLIEIFAKAFQTHDRVEAKQPAGPPVTAPVKSKKTADREKSRYLPLEAADFAHKIKEIAGNSPTLTAGGINIIGLSGIKKHFGDKWPKMADKVHAIVRQSISRHLSQDDVFTSYQDTAYIIVFSRLTPDQGQLKCALIAEEISRRIFGEKANPSLIEVAVTTMDAEKGVSISRLDLEEFSKKIDHGQLKGVKRHEIFTPSDPPRAPSSRPVGSMEGASGEEAGEEKIAKFREEVEFLAKLSPQEKKEYSFGRLKFVYRPMWLVKKGVMAAHVCIPARISSEGTVLVGSAAVLASPGSHANAEHDCSCLIEAANELNLLMSQGRKPVLIVPVHYVTLTEPKHRSEYRKITKSMPKDFHDRLLFEVIGIPQGAPRNRLEESILLLKSSNDNSLIRVRLDNKDFTKFSGLGFYAVGFDISNLDEPEAKLVDGINRFAERAEQQGLKIYARGLKTKSLISAAVCAGYDYIDGDPVTSPVETPGETAPFSIKTLYGAKNKHPHE